MTSARSPGSGPPPPGADGVELMDDAVGVVDDDVTLVSELSSPLLAPSTKTTSSVVTLNCHCLFKLLLEN